MFARLLFLFPIALMLKYLYDSLIAPTYVAFHLDLHLVPDKDILCRSILDVTYYDVELPDVPQHVLSCTERRVQLLCHLYFQNLGVCVGFQQIQRHPPPRPLARQLFGIHLFYR
jgi:hypothetical protein